MGISKHIFVTSTIQNHPIVDAAGIGGRKKLLPGEVSWCRVHREKSAEAIVAGSNEPS